MLHDDGRAQLHVIIETHEIIAIQHRLKAWRIENLVLYEQPIEQIGAQKRYARAKAPAEILRQHALAHAIDNRRREHGRKRRACQGPIPAPLSENIGVGGDRPFDQWLG